jgi:predicted ATP-grasp superfamily ATP-dependent carboligase
MGTDAGALACVLGGMDLVAPLGRAGIRCAVVVRPDDPARWSRHVVARLDKLNAHAEPDAYVERLIGWARQQREPPVLYYMTDSTLVMTSRHRDALAAVFRLVLPDADLVEDLTDKARFARLCARLALPAPRTLTLPDGGADGGAGRAAGLRFPVVVKPATHQERLGLAGKAARVGSPGELAVLEQRAERAGLRLLVQEMVPGPETRVESYHAYVDAAGVVAEFTGEKVRTKPAEFGWSTRLRISDSADVRTVGRAVVEAIGLRGVCKIDLKRDDDGRLWLLEINPRFTLWHNPGAAAGVNLPALVYADLTGAPRPTIGPVRAGVTWTDPFRRHPDEPVRTWLRAVVASDTRPTGQWSDPLPLVRRIVSPYGSSRAQGVRAARVVRHLLR